MKYGIIAKLLVLTLALGCSVAEHGQPTPWTAVYRERTGQVTPHDLAIRLPRVLARNGFLIDRVEQHHKDYLFLTHWKDRHPFEDERLNGYDAARTRLRLRAHWDGRLYVVHFEAENLVRTGVGEWVRVPPQKMFTEYAREMASEIRLEIASGLRRY